MSGRRTVEDFSRLEASSSDVTQESERNISGSSGSVDIPTISHSSSLMSLGSEPEGSQASDQGDVVIVGGCSILSQELQIIKDKMNALTNYYKLSHVIKSKNAPDTSSKVLGKTIKVYNLKAKCQKCFAEVSFWNNTTGNLVSHYKTKHTRDLSELKGAISRTSRRGLKHPSGDDQLQRHQLSVKESFGQATRFTQDKGKEAMTKWFARCLIPLSVTDHSATREMFQVFQPEFRVPSRLSLTRDIKTMGEEAREEFKEKSFSLLLNSKDGSSVPKEVDLSYKEHAPHHLLHNNHPSLVLQSLADDECFMDVTLTAAGTAIKAHKSVLSAMSPYFRDVLKANPSPHPIIVMPRDVTFQELKNIIGYIYKGEITIDGSELKSFLKTADTLQIVGLMSSETDPNLDKEAALPNCGASKEKGQKRKRGRDLSDVPLREGVDRDDPLDWETDMTLVKEELSDVSELENIWLPETEDFSSATTSFPSLEKKHESEAKRRRASSSLPLLAPDDSLKGSLEESPHQTRRAAEESPHQTRRVAEESPHQTRRAVRAKGKKTSSARTSDAAESLPTSSEVNPPPSLDDKESVFTEIGTCDALPPATKTKQTLDS